jgi:cysteinyl-tRNA synthetase
VPDVSVWGLLRYPGGMALHLYNSLTKAEEDFDAYMASKSSKEVSMYTCGPTVYSRPHIGNYSAFLMADLLRRWLEAKNYTVKHVKNITDVGHLLHDADQGDDKIQAQAEKEKVHPLDIAKRYTDMYLEDERTLKILDPAARPKATEYIEEMKAMIVTLLQKGIAYPTDDGIYFDVTQFKDYGKLSGNTLENVASGSRVEVNEAKRHPADFALWKFCVGNNAHHVLKWPSPKIPGTQQHPSAGAGFSDAAPEGFPGWHIECSAMSSALLGERIDLHTGGEDNIFPHHECEIAQSEMCTGKEPFVRFWLHKRRIDLEGEKMSKSLGNVLNITDILAKGYSAQDLRYYLLSVHYRTNLKFSWKGMDDAKHARQRLMEWMTEVLSDTMFAGFMTNQSNTPDAMRIESVKKFAREFSSAMDSDLNVSAAIAAVFECMSESRRLGIWKGDSLDLLKQFVQKIQRTFGCFDPEISSAIPADVQELLDARLASREAKNFAESDRLREEILKKGFEVRDAAGKQVVKKL